MRSAVCPKSLDHAELHFRVSFLIRIPDNAGSSFTVAAKETRTTFVLFRLANGNAQISKLQRIAQIWLKSAVCTKILDHAGLHFRVSFLTRIPENASNSFTAAAKEIRTTFVLSKLAK